MIDFVLRQSRGIGIVDSNICAKYGTGRIYTVTAPRQINRYLGAQPWGKAYLEQWPYMSAYGAVPAARVCATL